MRLRYTCLAVAMLLVLSACSGSSEPSPPQPAPQPAPPRREPAVARITTLKESGGRLDWSPKNVIAFDQLGADSYFDVFTMNPDGSNERCLTCNRPELPNRHMGNPAWHPSGDYIVFQVQKADAPVNPILDYFANPGAGVNNDLWVMDSGATRFWRLTNVELFNGGVLHPHFSTQGDKLLWSQRVSAQGGPTGEWSLKVADFRISSGTPRIENIRTFQPGVQHRFYESHGFTPDGRKILFSGNLEAGQSESGGDIYTLDLDSGALTNLTNTPADWDEHAQISPRGGWIAWMSSSGPGGTARRSGKSPFSMSRVGQSTFPEASRPLTVPGVRMEPG
jgi:Tol biopolymer transport system component